MVSRLQNWSWCVAEEKNHFSLPGIETQGHPPCSLLTTLAMIKATHKDKIKNCKLKSFTTAKRQLMWLSLVCGFCIIEALLPRIWCWRNEHGGYTPLSIWCPSLYLFVNWSLQWSSWSDWLFCGRFCLVCWNRCILHFSLLFSNFKKLRCLYYTSLASSWWQEFPIHSFM